MATVPEDLNQVAAASEQLIASMQPATMHPTERRACPTNTQASSNVVEIIHMAGHSRCWGGSRAAEVPLGLAAFGAV